MRAAAAAAAAGAVLLAAGHAAGHVAPSTRENNRYTVVAPVGDRVRLAYIVYIGEEPGRAARAHMDWDRNGRIDEQEAQRYADEVAAQVAGRLTVELDGSARPVAWHSVNLGLDDPSVTGGSFAIDLVAWFCFDRSADETHTLRYTDRFEIPLPGESELRAEESPGVRVTRSLLGGDASAHAAGRPRLDFRWRGGAGPAERGYDLAFTVDPAVATFLGTCPAPLGAAAPASSRRHLWLILGAAALVLAFLALWRFKKSADATARRGS